MRLRNVLTKAELKLAEGSESRGGQELDLRITLLEQGRPLLEEAVQRILGVKAFAAKNLKAFDLGMDAARRCMTKREG